VIDWLNDNSGAVQAVATVILVAVTLAYVLLTRSINRNAAKQADASRKMADEMHKQGLDADRPYLLIEAQSLGNVQWKEVESLDAADADPCSAYPKAMSCLILNAGRGPAKEVAVGAIHPLVAYQGMRKDVLAPGESWVVSLVASESLAYIALDDSPKGINAWMVSQGIDSPSLGESYDFGLIVRCTDIHDRVWATYLRFGLASSTDVVRGIVTSRTLYPIEHRIVRLGGQ